MRLSDWRDRLFPSPDLNDLVFWALDLETSGLDSRRDRILAVGMVPIRAGVIRYGQRYHSLVRPPDLHALSTEGLRAHHLLPSDLASAPCLTDVLPGVDGRLREGVLLLHHAPLDSAFLKEAYRQRDMPWPAPPVVDTVDLLLRLHRRREQWVPHPGPLRTSLSASRDALGLPAYPGHDALSDALATAELFLVLRHRLEACKLHHLGVRGARRTLHIPRRRGRT